MYCILIFMSHKPLPRLVGYAFCHILLCKITTDKNFDRVHESGFA